MENVDLASSFNIAFLLQQFISRTCLPRATNYTFQGCNNSCSPHNDIFCDKCIRTMLVCRVALGNEYMAQAAMNSLTQPPEGFHCVIGDPKNCCKSLHYKEYAIYYNAQVYIFFDLNWISTFLQVISFLISGLSRSSSQIQNKKNRSTFRDINSYIQYVLFKNQEYNVWVYFIKNFIPVSNLTFIQ